MAEWHDVVVLIRIPDKARRYLSRTRVICSTLADPHKETMKRRYQLLLHQRHDRRYPETGKIIQEYYPSPSSVQQSKPNASIPIREEELLLERQETVARLREFLPDLEITEMTKAN